VELSLQKYFTWSVTSQRSRELFFRPPTQEEDKLFETATFPNRSLRNLLLFLAKSKQQNALSLFFLSTELGRFLVGGQGMGLVTDWCEHTSPHFFDLRLSGVLASIVAFIDSKCLFTLI
jgi:hypothetical protein